jgi:hypothetical protein
LLGYRERVTELDPRSEPAAGGITRRELRVRRGISRRELGVRRGIFSADRIEFDTLELGAGPLGGRIRRDAEAVQRSDDTPGRASRRIRDDVHRSNEYRQRAADIHQHAV